MKFRENNGSGFESRESVSFGPMEVCALDSAFDNPQNAEAVETMRQKFPDTYTSTSTEFFKDCTSMSFDKEKFGDFIDAMKGVVDGEMESLTKSPDLSVLPCGHRVAEHAMALRSISKKVY
jgi:uncharacterized short protein YbdD (DUF466 family)